MKAHLRRLFPFTSQALEQPRGVAILMVLFFLIFMVFLVTSVSYDTIVEYSSASRRISRLKARYAAKAGVEISLLRIHLYRKAKALLGSKLGGQAQQLDVIWNFPFAWPLTDFLPDDVSLADKSFISGIEEKSAMDASYTTQISVEGSRIDINDLGADSKGLQKSTRQQILNIFLREIEFNEKFREKYEDFDFEMLLNNMVDWVDRDQQSLNGGSERDQYYDIEEIDFSSFNEDFYPPNEPFKTLDEIHMVAMMEDELFDVIKDRITIFGSKGVNINYASKEVLLSLDPQMSEEVASKVISRRQSPELGGPFKTEKEFLTFISNVEDSLVDTSTFNEEGIPLLFETSYTFRISSIGQFANSIQEIVVITYDFEATKNQLLNIFEKEDQESQGSSSARDNSNKNKKKDIPKGRPRVVYWEER